MQCNFHMDAINLTDFDFVRVCMCCKHDVLCVCMYECMYVCVHVCVCVCTLCLCMCVCMYVYACMYVFTCVYTLFVYVCVI